MVHEKEIVLPRRAIPQPSPHVVPGGDCGGCCIAGVLDVSIVRAYDLQDKDTRPKDARDKPVPFGWCEMVYALQNAGWGWSHLVDSVIDEVPIWPCWRNKHTWGMGLPGWSMNLPWWMYVRMALLAGYYGVCQVSLDGKGPLAMSDHWVLICGARQVEVPHPTMKGASRVDLEILVSCSARHPQGEWRDSLKFLQECGGFNIILVRPI